MWLRVDQNARVSQARPPAVKPHLLQFLAQFIHLNTDCTWTKESVHIHHRLHQLTCCEVHSISLCPGIDDRRLSHSTTAGFRQSDPPAVNSPPHNENWKQAGYKCLHCA